MHTYIQVEDIFTDLTIDPERFMDGHAHKGILRSAQYIAQVWCIYVRMYASMYACM